MISRLSKIINKNNLLLLSRRTYASTASASEGMRIPTSGGFTLKSKTTDANTSEKLVGNNYTPENKQVFWMRNPTTGDWVPETHFEEVDVAELRQKLLHNKQG